MGVAGFDSLPCGLVQFNSALSGVPTVTGGISMNGGKGNEE